MKTQAVSYKRKVFMSFDIRYVFPYMLGVIGGGIAYLNGAPSLLHTLIGDKIADMAWAFFIAIVSGIGGVIGGKIGKAIFVSLIQI